MAMSFTLNIPPLITIDAITRQTMQRMPAKLLTKGLKGPYEGPSPKIGTSFI